MNSLNIFAYDNLLDRLSKLGLPLERLNEKIKWEMFRPVLNTALEKEPKAPGGRPPYDYILMFKILILQRMYNISDDKTEFEICDRASFKCFLGLGIEDNIPDAKTIWAFRDKLAQKEIGHKLFDKFEKMMEEAGLITHTGSIIDATFVDVPKQHNHHQENEDIKNDKVPEEWEDEDQKNKRRQKDTDARWASKNKERHFGYKDHCKVDAESKTIVDYDVTNASTHDSNVFTELLDPEEDQTVYADSAYVGKTVPEGIENQVHEKGYRNHPLTEEQKASNKEKSRVRVRIEHVFAHMTNSMNGINIRSIGMCRAKFNIGMMNLTYNIKRYEFLLRSKATKGSVCQNAG